MRLVDADKLKVLVAVEDGGIIATGKLVSGLFDDMETVEAIPIEWIKTYAAKLARGYRCFQDDSSDIETMLNDWEKENETR